jgi:hypothetical protein
VLCDRQGLLLNAGGDLQMPTELRARSAARQRSRRVAALIDADLIAIVQFCLIGLLVTLVVMFWFPDLGALIAQYNQF